MPPDPVEQRCPGSGRSPAGAPCPRPTSRGWPGRTMPHAWADPRSFSMDHVCGSWVAVWPLRRPLSQRLPAGFEPTLAAKREIWEGVGAEVRTSADRPVAAAWGASADLSIFPPSRTLRQRSWMSVSPTSLPGTPFLVTRPADTDRAMRFSSLLYRDPTAWTPPQAPNGCLRRRGAGQPHPGLSAPVDGRIVDQMARSGKNGLGNGRPSRPDSTRPATGSAGRRGRPTGPRPAPQCGCRRPGWGSPLPRPPSGPCRPRPGSP